MVVTVGASHHLGGILPTFRSCLPLAYRYQSFQSTWLELLASYLCVDRSEEIGSKVMFKQSTQEGQEHLAMVF